MKINFGDKMFGFQLGTVDIRESKISSKQNVDVMLREVGCGEHGEVEAICKGDCSSQENK